jgi:hypothetical protein
VAYDRANDSKETEGGMAAWIEIYESLPPEGQLVLWLRHADKEWPVLAGKRDGESINWGGDLNMKIEPFVTHWMPLPAPPETSK